jgi:TPR repeat protein
MAGGGDGVQKLLTLQEQIYRLFGDVYGYALGLCREDLLKLFNSLVVLITGDADPLDLPLDLSTLIDELRQVVISSLPVSEKVDILCVICVRVTVLEPVRSRLSIRLQSLPDITFLYLYEAFRAIEVATGEMYPLVRCALVGLAQLGRAEAARAVEREQPPVESALVQPLEPPKDEGPIGVETQQESIGRPIEKSVAAMPVDEQAEAVLAGAQPGVGREAVPAEGKPDAVPGEERPEVVAEEGEASPKAEVRLQSPSDDAPDAVRYGGVEGPQKVAREPEATEEVQSAACQDVGPALEVGLIPNGAAAGVEAGLQGLSPASVRGDARAHMKTARKLDAKDPAKAARYFELAADQGEAAAQLQFGVQLSAGIGIEKDEARAVRYFRLAADQGEAQAAFRLGTALLNGAGVAVDVAEGTRYLRLAAAAGLARAQAELGAFLLANGQGDEAERFLRLAAANGDAASAFTLGRRLLRRDAVEGARFLKRAGDRGHWQARAEFGLCLAQGTGVATNEKKAVRCFRLAAEHGVALGQLYYGLALGSGAGGVKKNASESGRLIRLAADGGCLEAQLRFAESRDPSERARYLGLAANQGHLESQRELVKCLRTGTGVARDAVAAARYTRLAADQGDAQSQFEIGAMLLKGTDVERDEAAAVGYLVKASDQGSTSAMLLLGERLGDARARDCLARAANAGYVEAQFRLGEALLQDDPVKAVGLLQLAANAGFARAQARLGTCLKKGVGVEKNEADGLRWHQLASEQGTRMGRRRTRCIS